MPPFRDLVGQTFNDLTAISPEGAGSNGNIMWRFRCVCGTEIVHKGSAVSKGDKISCGCHKVKKRITPRLCSRCGGTSTRLNQRGYVGNICHDCWSGDMSEYRRREPKKWMVVTARGRAKKGRYPCTITHEDFEIPEFCPVLGIKMAFGGFAERDNAPSLDKIIPELGYVPGNIAVMSFRANRFKNDASPEELRLIADWIERNRPKIELVA